MSGDGADGEGPVVPAESLDGWALVERTSEVVFRLPAATVEGHTLLYEDDRLGRAVREATDGELDRTWRFFFATSLTFTPPLPPGIGPAVIYSTVATEAEDRFRSELRGRGFRDVTQGRRERVRVDSGERARLRKYDAVVDLTLPDGAAVELPTEGWLAVWPRNGQFRLAAGAYPSTPLAAALGRDAEALETDPAAFREELLDLIRAVR